MIWTLGPEMETKFPKTLEEAVAAGPELTADFLRQRLMILLADLQDGADPKAAVESFQARLGMDEMPVMKREIA